MSRGSIEYGSPVPGQVSFQWKNPDFLSKNPDFLLKNVDSIIKTQVIGGRWKPLHYILASSTFASQMSTCNTAGACIVKNDSPLAFEGSASVRLINMVTGKSVPMVKHAVSLPPGAGVAEWYCGTNSGDDVEHDSEAACPASSPVSGSGVHGSPPENYTRHYQQIPTGRSNYTKNSPLVSEKNCLAACDADKACVGFTAIDWPTGDCYLYEAPHKLSENTSSLTV